MDRDLEKKILRARELIYSSRHISIATVNEDGSPHNSPIRFLYDADLKHIFWGSHPDSMHSRNIARTGQIFAVLYDRNERGGVYIKAENARELDGNELEKALSIHNEFRAKEGSRILPLTYYTGESPQRMYAADITDFWINSAEKDSDGLLIKDSRIKISAIDLLR